MRTLVFTPHLTRRGGGLFEAVSRLSRTMAQLGAQVEVLGLADQFVAEDLPAWTPARARAFRVFGPRAIGWSPELRVASEKIHADIAHAHGLWMDSGRACQLWAKQSGKPYVISPHGMLDPWALNRSRWKKRVAGWLFQNEHLRRAACIHALCQPEAEAIRALGFRNPICVIPNGVDLPPVNRSQPPAWDSAVPHNAKVLFYLGRLHPKKGLMNLLRAWDSVGNPDWHLVVAGWDQDGHESDLKNLAREIGAERVHFPGAQFGVRKDAAFRVCDAFVLPSLSEGLPMAVLEAWANAKPVLMTRECHLPEGFASRAAIEITPDVETIVRGLREMFSKSDSERRSMGARGRELVEARFTWPVIARETLAVYEWLAGNGAPPAGVRVD